MLLIVEEIQQEVVLEMDFMAQYKVTWDWDEKVLRLGAVRRPDLRSTVILPDGCLVLALSDNVIFGQLYPPTLSPDAGLVSGCRRVCRRLGIVIDNVLANPVNGLVPLRILNPQGEDVVI